MSSLNKTALANPGYFNFANSQKRSPRVPGRLWRQGILEPLDHVLAADGKRLRADLVEITFRAAGGLGSVPLEVIDFVELMHAGSLVIDDIEDRSTERRGQPTLHTLVGTPLAINTGNWMYFSALEKLLDLPVRQKHLLGTYSETLATIRRAHEGQALDLAADVTEMNRDEIYPTIRAISKLKTGGIVALASKLGAALADADERSQKAFHAFGMQLGTSLQMQNDIAELKDATKLNGRSDDLRNHRITWPWAWLSQRVTEKEFNEVRRLLQGCSSDEFHLVARELLASVSQVFSQYVSGEIDSAIANIRGSVKSHSEELIELTERLKQYHV
ncbi:MAG: hypothetical protein CMJ77_02685 [Planctomycetaceae bacterium]|nr:hypothetical protein [Planctomycetaceae bacterium]